MFVALMFNWDIYMFVCACVASSRIKFPLTYQSLNQHFQIICYWFISPFCHLLPLSLVNTRFCFFFFCFFPLETNVSDFSTESRLHFFLFVCSETKFVNHWSKTFLWYSGYEHISLQLSPCGNYQCFWY